MVCTRPITRSMTNFLKTCMTSLTLVYHQFQNYGSDQVDFLLLINKTSFNLDEFAYVPVVLGQSENVNDMNKINRSQFLTLKISFLQTKFIQERMRKNLTIRCDDDSLQYPCEREIQTTKNQRKSPSHLYKTAKDFNLIQKVTICQTPQSRQTPSQSFQFKSPKYAGIFEKNILQRLEYYGQKHRQKKQAQNVSTRVIQEEAHLRKLRQKPEINQISKSIYEKVKKQRKLSPNVLQRFQNYECERVSRKAKYELLKTYGMEIKNTTATCRKTINNCSRSPLKQSDMNKQKSRGKSKSLLKKTVKNPQNYGKIVHRNPTQNCTEKKQPKYSTLDSELPNYESYNLLTPNAKSSFQRKKYPYHLQVCESGLSGKRNTPQYRIDEDTNKDRSRSPLEQKKPKASKWKVIT